MKFLNLHNYLDKTYRYVVLTCIFSFAIIGDILTPLLNYIAIELPKANPHFYNYATIANLAPSLPFMLSFLISYVINNLRYRHVLLLCFIGSISLSLIILLLQYNGFILLTFYVVGCSFLFRGLYLALDKQLTTILMDKVRDFQSDMFIWGGLLGALNMQLSAYVYSHYKLRGIVIIFILASIILWWLASQIPPAIKLEQQSSKPKLNPLLVLKTMWQHKPLVSLAALMLIIIMASGTFNILLTSKMHHDQISITTYASLNSISMILGVLTALSCKSKLMIRISTHKIIAISIVLSSLCLIGMGLSNTLHNFIVFYIILGMAGNIQFINMNTLFFRHISLSEDLSKISPLIIGIWGSLVYVVSLIGQLGINILLNYNINFQTVYIVIGIVSLVCASFMFNLKQQPNN